jgi:hypothetical protein
LGCSRSGSEVCSREGLGSVEASFPFFANLLQSVIVSTCWMMSAAGFGRRTGPISLGARYEEEFVAEDLLLAVRAVERVLGEKASASSAT